MKKTFDTNIKFRFKVFFQLHKKASFFRNFSSKRNHTKVVLHIQHLYQKSHNFQYTIPKTSEIFPKGFGFKIANRNGTKERMRIYKVDYLSYFKMSLGKQTHKYWFRKLYNLTTLYFCAKIDRRVCRDVVNLYI